MGLGIFKNLTKTGVVDPRTGEVVYFDSPAAAGIANAQAMQGLVRPEMPVADETIPYVPDRMVGEDPAEPPDQPLGAIPQMAANVAGSLDTEPPNFQAQEPAALPRTVKPSFQQATTDQYGNVTPGMSPALTKRGALLKILKGGLQGGMDAIAGGALDAPQHGESSFGRGMAAAQQMPLLRVARAQQQRQAELQSQMAEESMRPVKTPWGVMPIWRAKQISELAKTEAEMNKDRYVTPRNGGVYDTQTGAFAPGTEPQDRVPNTPEGRRAFVQANPDLFADDNERAQYVLYGTREPSGPKDSKIGERVGPDNVKYATFQKPDGRTYEVKIGAERAPASTIADNAKDVDVETAAEALLDPRSLTALKDISSMRGDQRLKIFNRATQLAKQRGIAWDPGVVNQRIRFLQSYEDPKGRAAINRQAINNILQHGGDLYDLNNQYRARQEFKPLNTPINKIADMFGSTAYTQFATVNSVLKDELALYFAGGYAPDQNQIQTWHKIQADEATPAQTEAFAREVARLAFRRANTFNGQFRKNMGYDDPSMLIPEAVTAAEKLGLGDEAKKFGSGGYIGGAGSGPSDTTGQGNKRQSNSPKQTTGTGGITFIPLN